MNFFIERPIFAAAIAFVMVIAGAVARLTLPILQYPPLVLPQVQVTTQFHRRQRQLTHIPATNAAEEDQRRGPR